MSNKNTQLILNSKQQHLGNTGDIIYVTRGYARNYLIPQNIAEPITKAKLNYITKLKKQEAKIYAQEKQSALNIKQQLESIHKFTTKRKISDNNNIFGSITEKDTLEIIKKATGITIEKSMIHQPIIKTIGLHDIYITLMNDIEVKLKLQVLPETT
uniref:Large ribosomal subunit protein bL9c n=1 Tax=Hommersandiophycus borowitzkae TaxID=268573 RepID=A0A1G4NUN5_9FLOR|nr:Ribosomal protein L9 [Hommersandiophycus borowitzkae]SCW22246.1 Ribosomal protein L9 [Hommersandiophycus borowitzkae]